jgi:Mg2+ and Co2+ transporter CorA
MKKIYGMLAAALLLGACTDKKQQEKDALNAVIEVHDEAMTLDEKAVNNKQVIDGLLKDKKISGDTIRAIQLSKALNTADENMENWMHQFSPDNTGKSHEQIMTYMADQKKMITKVNQELDSVIKRSDDYLRPYKK